MSGGCPPTPASPGIERLLVVVLLVAVSGLFVYRLVHLDGDLIYRHSYGESQYAMWARAYVEEGFFWGTRQVDAFSPIVNYVPLSSCLAALVHRLAGGDLVVIGRAVSLLFSALTAVTFYRLGLLLFESRLKAATALFIFSVIPINLYYSKTFYNDPLHLFFLVAFFHGFCCFVRGRELPGLRAGIAVALALLLLTKASTLLLCLPPVLYHFLRERRGTVLSRLQAATPFWLPVLAVAGLLVASRLLHPSAYQVESNKLIHGAFLADLPRQLAAAKGELLSEFGLYLLLFLPGWVLAFCRRGLFRHLAFAAVGFAVFYVLLLPGALVHQYYLLPLALPFAMLATLALFVLLDQVGHVRLRSFSLIFFLVLLAPAPGQIQRIFDPLYSRGLIEVVEAMRARPDRADSLVLGRSCRIIQYYLGLPSRNLKCEKESFLAAEGLNAMTLQERPRYLITEELEGSGFSAYRSYGYVPLFRSVEGNGAVKYFVYRLAEPPPSLMESGRHG